MCFIFFGLNRRQFHFQKINSSKQKNLKEGKKHKHRLYKWDQILWNKSSLSLQTTNSAVVSGLQQNGVLTDKTSITFKSKLQFPDEANSLAGFLWPFCRFSILLLWPPGGWSSLPSLPLSSFLWVFVSDDFQNVTGHEASLLSTRHSDEAAAFALAAHANLRVKKSYLWQHLRIENTVYKYSQTK